MSKKTGTPETPKSLERLARSNGATPQSILHGIESTYGCGTDIGIHVGSGLSVVVLKQQQHNRPLPDAEEIGLSPDDVVQVLLDDET